MKTNIRKALALLVALIGLILSLPFNADAQTLQPRLLWEKKLPFEDIPNMARLSGDVITCSQEERQIILYDKNGNEVFHWGPRIDRQPRGCEVSDDGSVILYTTTFTESYLEQKKIAGDWDWGRRIHYATRKGKELWNKPISGAAELSPDGKMIAVIPVAGVGGKDLTVFDSQGNPLWTFAAGGDVFAFAFSPDSQYLGLQGKGGYTLLDKTGTVIWKKTDIFAGGSFISDMARYTTIEGTGRSSVKKVYDKQGNLVFEGDGMVSEDGQRMLVVYPDKHSILNLPDKTLIGEYPGGGFLSHDGRLLSTRTSYPSGNFRAIDTLDHTFGDIPVSMVNVSSVRSTKDGKYLILVVDNNKIFYYQLY